MAKIKVSVTGTPKIQHGARGVTSQFWTEKLPENLPVPTTSVAWSQRLRDQATSMISGTPFYNAYTGEYGTRTSTDEKYSIPIYQTSINSPLVPVWCKNDKYYMDGTTRVSIRDKFSAGIPLPDPAHMPNGRIQPVGSDGSIAVISGFQGWEVWRFGPADSSTPAGFQYQCSQGGHIADIRTHPGWWAGSGNENAPLRGGDFGMSASGMAYLGAILRGVDFYADEITHPLAVALPETGGYGTADYPYFVFPATRGDRLGQLKPLADGPQDTTKVKLPEGARFRLDPAIATDAAISAYAAQKGLAVAGSKGSTAATLAKVMRALRDRGLVVSDFAQIVGFSAESDMTYGTIYNPLSIEQKPLWGNFGQQLPWEWFVQVPPLTQTIAVRGSE